EGELQILGTSALRWYLVGVPFLGINGAIRAYLQGMGKEKEASLFTMVNMLLLPVIVTWFMARQMGTTGIFAAFAVHEIVLTVSIALWQLRGRAGAKAGTQPAGENRRDVNQHQHRPIIGEEDWSPVSAEVRGTLNGLPEVAAASQTVIDLCLAHGVAPKRAMQMGLCLEELAANSIEHGFAAGKPGYLEYRFLITAEQLILRLRDNGRAFDLT
ncbi:MAG: polysaccharide biosynthesis C-terminal domain-containing protein, partial [Clostridia bacterium]|nr:polysaccharide biosynthesis C-terminal domain-containing protein [Clostridia bacterium]